MIGDKGRHRKRLREETIMGMDGQPDPGRLHRRVTGVSGHVAGTGACPARSGHARGRD
ncbi:hypothetical protein [Streptomyces sp. MN13]